MAPQLTEAKVHKTEAKYDGCKADVWSMGVLLAVRMVKWHLMLLVCMMY